MRAWTGGCSTTFTIATPSPITCSGWISASSRAVGGSTGFRPTGEPIRLAHKVESTKLDSLPGEKRLYLSWRELHAGLKAMLGSARKVAMQYSPLANIPYVSIVDGGTIDLIRSLGFEVVSSAGLVQTFQAVLDEAGYQIAPRGAASASSGSRTRRSR